MYLVLSKPAEVDLTCDHCRYCIIEIYLQFGSQDSAITFELQKCLCSPFLRTGNIIVHSFLAL